MRVVILASANSGCDVLPTILRDLKTVPAGSPPPIFSAMQCSPSGVQFEPSICPMPKREVEQGNCLTNFPSSNSDTVWRGDGHGQNEISSVRCPAGHRLKHTLRVFLDSWKNLRADRRNRLPAKCPRSLRK